MEQIKKLFKRICYGRMVNACNNFEIWKAFQESISPNNKDHEKNLEIYNKYVGFFMVIMNNSLPSYFALELNKFFDRNGSNLSLMKIVNKINDDTLKKEVDEILNNNKKTIDDLKLFRDENLAHDDITKTINKVEIEKLESLFKLAETIINKISLFIDNSVFSFETIKNDSKDSFERLLNDLKFYRNKELEIIEDFKTGKISFEEYNVKLP